MWKAACCPLPSAGEPFDRLRATSDVEWGRREQSERGERGLFLYTFQELPLSPDSHSLVSALSRVGERATIHGLLPSAPPSL